MRRLLAAYPRRSALVLALIVGALLSTAGAVALMSYQQTGVQRSLDVAAKKIVRLNVDLVGALRLLHSWVPPGCDEATLRRLRSVRVHNSSIADIAVRGQDGTVHCSTTAGILPRPVEIGPADYRHVSADKLAIEHFVARHLPGLEDAETTLHIGLGRYVISPPADVLDGLLQGGVRAVRLVREDGSLGRVVEDDNLPQVNSAGDFETNGENRQPAQDGWNGLNYARSSLTSGFPYLIEGRLSAATLIRNHTLLIIALALLPVFAACLTFFVVEPMFRRWACLEYRLPDLLQANTVLCRYQPIVELATGRICGCEVLMRLRDGAAIIAPDLLLPVIMARKLTWRLDRLVVQVAIEELSRITPVLEDFRVAINFFPSSIRSGEVGTMIENTLSGTPLANVRFNIEVLEHDCQDSLVRSLTDLRRRGFLVSVDDFGTGFSNLRTIKRLSPDFLKIDRTFVGDMFDGTLRCSLIPEIVGIARATGAKLVAEGIETAQQYALLKKMGVEYGQGYFISRPLDIDALAGWLLAARDGGLALQAS